uniref:Uncharacterized protein n=1 Tax=Pyxicephalus adspersus TaxID=30357 RepID=A0AAV2ZTJ9_PYXAD|nr:TPA: hypothetical protein GDO54_018337 [Pyxicephalus adspersus]
MWGPMRSTHQVTTGQGNDHQYGTSIVMAMVSCGAAPGLQGSRMRFLELYSTTSQEALRKSVWHYKSQHAHNAPLRLKVGSGNWPVFVCAEAISSILTVRIQRDRSLGIYRPIAVYGLSSANNHWII